MTEEERELYRALAAGDLEGLAKRSKNVREQTRSISPEQAKGRRVKYAQSVGLKPKEVIVPRGDFPRAARNTLPHGSMFGVEHETAHALMTPPNKTVGQYQKWLTGHARADLSRDDADMEHEEATQHENQANDVENLIDRRAGVGPSAHRSGFRRVDTKPSGWTDDGEDGNVDDDATERARVAGGKDIFGHAVPSKTQGRLPIPSPEFRADSQYTVDRFDQGARFNHLGRVVPGGLNARVNAGHAGVTWLRQTRAKLGLGS